jgi:trk system potassium uptake protein TrkA
MKIIIAGAGDMGFHLAGLLVTENNDIILIDTSQEVLDYASTHLDVMTLRGDSTSINVLKDAGISNAKLLLAVTTSENTNICTAILAKKMGAHNVIARVSKQEYLKEDQKLMFKELGIDSVISPTLLASEEIYRLVRECSFTDHFAFEEGKANLIGITLDDYSPLVNQQVLSINGMKEDVNLRPIAILRGHRTIIPRGNTVLRRHDHIYFITHGNNNDKLINLVGKKKVNVKNVMILGGTQLGEATAKRLEKEYNVTLIDKNKDHCKLLAERLHNTLIIHGDYSNISLLEEEGLNHMDALIALSNNSETNIITSLTAKSHGVYKTIAQVENKEYIHISQNIGVDTLINKKLIAANNIFRFIRKGQVEAITSLHGVDAEIIEYVITRNNQITRKQIKDLHFPETALIGSVIRGEETIIPNGEFQLQMNDKVIVLALPGAINRLEKLFN